jgi:hypothetical protein
MSVSKTPIAWFFLLTAPLQFHVIILISSPSLVDIEPNDIRKSPFYRGEIPLAFTILRYELIEWSAFKYKEIGVPPDSFGRDVPLKTFDKRKKGYFYVSFLILKGWL